MQADASQALHSKREKCVMYRIDGIAERPSTSQT
jgi:hypothetical protein